MGKKYTPESAQRFFNKYNCFEKLGFTGADINAYYKEWEGLPTSLFFNDFLWSLFNKAILRNVDYLSNTDDEANFHFNNFHIYYDMAKFRKEEGASVKVVNQFMKIALESNYQRSLCNLSHRLEYQTVVLSGHCCSYCDQFNNNKYDLEDYNLNPRLDLDKCTNEWGCNCALSIVVKRDENGNIIRKLSS